MLSEFESRLADVLGTRLPAPLAGAVDVAPGRDTSRLVVSVRSAAPFEDDLLSIRPERVPGLPAPRRVVRLRCEIGLEARIPAGGTRADAMNAIDQTIYLLGDTGIRDGSAFLPGDNSDPGFLIRRLRLTNVTVSTALTAEAEGLFWPVGTSGQAGPAIVETRIRAAFLPLLLNPPNPRLTPGGDGIDLRIEFGAVGTMQVTTGGEVSGLPYGSVIVSVIDSGGRPGAGVLTGGSDGPAGSRVIPVAQGAAAVRYTPPASAAVDQLVVALEDNEGGSGIELGRFTLPVRSA